MPFDLFGPLLAVPASIEDLDLNHQLTLVALAAFSTVWVTALGAAVGSFLNVVVYRLPQGLSLVRPKSRCPACGTSIRAGDNVPVLGWLRLRGRCRACGSRISSRYPLVEATTALLFLGLAHFELFSGGSNLPNGPEGGSRLGFVLWHIQPDLVGLFAYHATLLSVLLCLVLIAADGFPPPRRLIMPALLIGLLFPVVLPSLHPVASGLPIDRLSWWSTQFGSISLRFVPSALVDGLTGLTVGAGVGLLTAGGVPMTRRAAADRRGSIAAGGLVGLFLGWQAAIACGWLAAAPVLINAIVSRLAGRSLPVTSLYAATVLVQIPLWGTLSQQAWWPGPLGWLLLRRVDWPEPAFAVTSLAAAAVVAGLTSFAAGQFAGSAIRE
ncbi:MAG: prepilin peptidase [Planctomycetaceae bacterium]